MTKGILDQTDKEGYRISELISLALKPHQKNELNDVAELKALTNNIKQAYYQDYKTAYTEGYKIYSVHKNLDQ